MGMFFPPSHTLHRLAFPLNISTVVCMNERGEAGPKQSIPDVRLNYNLLTNAESFYIIFLWHLFSSNHYGAESFSGLKLGGRSITGNWLKGKWHWPRLWLGGAVRTRARTGPIPRPFHYVLLFVHKRRSGLVSPAPLTGWEAGDWQRDRMWKTLRVNINQSRDSISACHTIVHAF